MYNEFSSVYDRLTDDVDYEKIYFFITQILKKFDKKPELVLELACGSGNFTELLCKNKFDVIALDNSSEMLDVAREKCLEALLLLQDMTKFELYGTVDAMFCVLDGVNYITDKHKLERMFKLADNYLNPGGIFIFDINSEYKLKNIIGNNTFVRSEDDIFYSWENEVLRNRVNFYLTFFVKNSDETFSRFEEMHTQRIYKVSELKDMIKNANLEFLGAFPDFKFKRLSKKDERIFIAVQKKS